MEVFRFLLALQETVGEQWLVDVRLDTDFKSLLIVLSMNYGGPPAQIFIPFEPSSPEVEILSELKVIVASQMDNFKSIIEDFNKPKQAKDLH